MVSSCLQQALTFWREKPKTACTSQEQRNKFIFFSFSFFSLSIFKRALLFYSEKISWAKVNKKIFLASYPLLRVLISSVWSELFLTKSKTLCLLALKFIYPSSERSQPHEQLLKFIPIGLALLQPGRPYFHL